MSQRKMQFDANITKLKKKIEVLEAKLNRRFFIGNKKKIKEEIQVLEMAYESALVMGELEKFFDVAEKEINDSHGKLTEEKTVTTMITTFCDVNDIPALEAKLFKHWKDKYGSVFVPTVTGETNA